MESKDVKVAGTSPPLRPLGPFYVEEPMSQYFPADAFLVQERKEEFLRIRISWGIRSGYPDWVNGLKSHEIRQKWLNEAKEKMDFGDFDPISMAYRGRVKATSMARISRKTWKMVIDELEQYAGQVDGLIQPGPLEGVTWMADGLVGQDLRDRLLSASEALEKVARKENNWHPGTEGRVLNLIDPSMHALIPGQTRVLETPFTPNEEGIVADLAHFASPTSPSTSWVHGHEDDFQWLPADVDVGLAGACHFRSYVNNLNPLEQGEMYGVLEEILSTTFVLLWEKLLTHMRRKQSSQKNTNSGQEEEEEEDTENQAVDLKGRRIQVIVRMATTHLTSDNPKHPGGQWHIEGVPKEKIVAVGVHYYSNQNITTAKLGLGERFRAGLLPGSSSRSVIRDTWELPTIETKEGRSVVFSNQLNHRVLPFELENPELPGHRKILAFFLVDPGTHDPVISTARVPCQQRSWYLAELKRVFSSILPPEMVEIVASFLDTPMDLNRAKELRDAMRKERSFNFVRVCGRSPCAYGKSFRVKPSTNLDNISNAVYETIAGMQDSFVLRMGGRLLGD